MMPRYLIESAHEIVLPHKNISEVSHLERGPNLTQNDLEQLKFRDKCRLVTLQTSSIDWSPLTDGDKRIISSAYNRQLTNSLKMWQPTISLRSSQVKISYKYIK